MSYNRQIWQNPPGKPLPSNIDEAVKVVEQLYDTEMNQPNPKFIALAEKLKQKFPDMSTAMPEEDEDEVNVNDLAWYETVEGDGLEAVWVLGLNTNDLFDGARALVTTEATVLGLCVLDEQAGEAYLPGGKVLVLPGQTNKLRASPANSQAPDTITVANKVFEIKTFYSPSRDKIVQEPPKNKELPPLAFQHLAPLMKEHGFKAKGKEFSRDLADGWCKVKIYSDCGNSLLYAKLTIIIDMYCQPIIDFMDKVEPHPDLPQGRIREYAPNSLRVDPDKWMEPIGDIKVHERSLGAGGYLIECYDQIEKVLTELTSKFTTVILPALDDCQTLADFERHLNPPGDNPTSIFEFHPMGRTRERIIAAYLLNTPALEPLCEKFGSWGAQGKRYVAYVRSHPLTKSN